MPEEGRSVIDETTVNAKEMAMVIGVSTRRVQQMIQDGTLQTVKKGSLLLERALSIYALIGAYRSLFSTCSIYL